METATVLKIWDRYFFKFTHDLHNVKYFKLSKIQALFVILFSLRKNEIELKLNY